VLWDGVFWPLLVRWACRARRGELAPGYKTYRDGEVVGFVAPLDHLAVREVSAHYLSGREVRDR